MLWQAQIIDNSLRRNKILIWIRMDKVRGKSYIYGECCCVFKAGRIISSIHCNEHHNSEATFKTCQGLGY